MSAAKRVAHAAETIRARWEQRVSTDPQTEAAQALEDSCQLLDPEVAAELEGLRSEAESSCVDWQRLRRAEQRRAELEAVLSTHRKDDQAEIERLRARVDEVERAYTFDTAELKRERDQVVAEIARFGIYGSAVPATKALVQRADELVTENASLRARVAELESERHSMNEALSDITAALREREASPLTVFRASHDSIVIGRYTTAPEARKHCETFLRREMPDVNLDWIEGEEDGVAELTAWIGGEECTTGYVVTPLEIASKHDEKADE